MDKDRFVVTHTEADLWSVSHNERILAVYRTETEALFHTFGLASSARRSGNETAVVISRARRGGHLHIPEDHTIGCGTPAGHYADIYRNEPDSSGLGATIVSLEHLREKLDRVQYRNSVQAVSELTA